LHAIVAECKELLSSTRAPYKLIYLVDRYHERCQERLDEFTKQLGTDADLFLKEPLEVQIVEWVDFQEKFEERWEDFNDVQALLLEKHLKKVAEMLSI
jgi:predicted DNA-binding protein